MNILNEDLVDNLDLSSQRIITNGFYLVKGLVIKGHSLGFSFVE